MAHFSTASSKEQFCPQNWHQLVYRWRKVTNGAEELPPPSCGGIIMLAQVLSRANTNINNHTSPFTSEHRKLKQLSRFITGSQTTTPWTLCPTSGSLHNYLSQLFNFPLNELWCTASERNNLHFQLAPTFSDLKQIINIIIQDRGQEDARLFVLRG